MTRLALFAAGLTVGLLAAAVLLAALASQSGAGHQSRHRRAAMGMWRTR